jgi:ATP-binding cassette subfamily B protein
LFDNVAYGAESEPLSGLSSALSCADLIEVLETLPEGLQTDLCEGGTRLSGGQGQRVRLARALMRASARLVLLDEPFRGLERPRRQELMKRIRARYPQATLLFVSHDVRDTLGFDRVLVVDGGQIVEDGPPARLFADPHSRYRALADADAALRQQIFQGTRWRRLRLENGKLTPHEDAQVRHEAAAE